MNASQEFRRYARWAVVLLPVVAIALIAAAHISETPFYDEWDLVPLLSNLRSGTLRLSQLAAAHNEHRILFPRLALLGLMSVLGKWSIRAEVYGNIALGLVQLFVIWRIARATLPRRAVLPVTLCASLLIFHAFQTYNWLMGFQLVWFIAVTAGLVAIWALTSHAGSWSGFALGVAMGVIGSFSMSALHLIWLIGLAPLLLLRAWRRIHLVLWILAAAATLGLYFAGLPASGNSAHMMANIAQPLAMTEFVFEFVGAPLGAQHGAAGAAAMGLMGMALLAVLVVRLARLPRTSSALAPLLPWLMIMALVVLSAGLIGAGRLHLENAALPRHYYGLSGLFWISLLGAHVAASSSSQTPVAERKRAADPIMLALLAPVAIVLVVSYGQAYVQGMREINTISDQLRRLELFMLRDAQNIPDDVILPVFPDPARLRRYAVTLRELNEGAFWHESAISRALRAMDAAQAPQTGPADYQGFLDTAECSGISGWVWNRSAPAGRVRVSIRVDGVEAATATADEPRPDLAAAGFGDGAYAFRVRLPDAARGGRPRTISAVVAGAGLELGNSPRTVTCP